MTYPSRQLQSDYRTRARRRLAGVPTLPADLAARLKSGFEPTGEQESRAAAAIREAMAEIRERNLAEGIL